jgi:tetratricopeptide (TPR) repeat protein
MALNTTTVTETNTSKWSSASFDATKAIFNAANCCEEIDCSEFQNWASSAIEPTLYASDRYAFENVTTAAPDPIPPSINKVYVEDFIVVWLDATIGPNDNTRNTIKQLRRVANDIETFTSPVACIQFISQIKEEKVFLIVSGSLGQEIVPYVTEFHQIEAIYVFCANQEKHMQWAKNYQKVHGVFIEIDLLCEHMRRRTRQLIHNYIGFFILGNSSTNKQEANFMYEQLFQDIILDMRPDRNGLADMIEFCRFQYANNPDQLEWISRFENECVHHSPAWWYTQEMFLYKIINKALRIQEIETLYALRFFIQHLHNQLSQLSKQSFIGNIINLYRGQIMYKDDFEKLKTNPGGLFSFSNFLSTSEDINTAMTFVPPILNDVNEIPVLMTIVVDPSVPKNVPFANIQRFSVYKTMEKEWLFSMGSIFRIGEIRTLPNGIWSVHLTLTNDYDRQLNNLKTYLKNEIEGRNSLIKFGIVLLEKGQHKKAERFYQRALTMVNHWQDLARIHNDLGLIYWNSKQLDDALKKFQLSIDIKRNGAPDNLSILAPTYSNIGTIYAAKNQFDLALDHYELALDIERQTSKYNHEGIASIYNNMANILCTQGEYSDGLSCHQQVLQIRLKVLPPTHPSISLSYSNIAKCFYLMGQFFEAIYHAQKAVDIDLQSLPIDHPQMQLHQNNLDIYRRALKS